MKNKRVKAAIMAVIKYIAIFGLGVALFALGHIIATEARGYIAFGGELFFLPLPLWWFIWERIGRDTKKDRERDAKKGR
jgi:hypothetical protein